MEIEPYEDQLPEESNFSPPHRHRSKWRYIIYAGIVIVIVFISFTVKASISSDEGVWSYLMNATDKYIKPRLPFSTTLAAITATPEADLQGMREDRINILLLGIGGRGHDGANLSDTIIVASYKPSEKQVAMLSIPRDLIVPIPGHGWRKINSLYALAEYNDLGTGGDYAKQIISQIFGLQIPYYVRIDFQGFVELIDLIGGIDIDVPRTLSDYQYPIPGREDYPDDSRYEHLYIEQGQQHFNGDTALKYVRSRHAQGEEGSDFARAVRQQLVMEATLDKILSMSTLLRPSKINKIITNIEESVDSNLSIEELAAFAKLAKNFKDHGNPIVSRVLDNSNDGPLQNAMYGEAFVLEPKVEDFSELKFIAKHLFDPEMIFERPTNPTGLPRVTIDNPVEAQEDVTIEIQNGTFVSGLARANQEQLEELGYEVIEIGNAEQQNYEDTVIYDLSDGEFKETLDFLAGNYTDNIKTRIPLGISSEADILIILGLDLAY